MSALRVKAINKTSGKEEVILEVDRQIQSGNLKDLSNSLRQLQNEINQSLTEVIEKAGSSSQPDDEKQFFEDDAESEDEPESAAPKTKKTKI